MEPSQSPVFGTDCPMTEDEPEWDIIDDPVPDGEKSAAAELPWPRFGDRLFGPDKDWYHNACLNFTFDSWDLYTSGYLEAAQLLVDATSNKRGSLDTMIYPMAFLYRHYLELRLKSIIVEGGELLGGRGKRPSHHNLDLLWKTARRIIEEIYSKESKEPIWAVEECIEQFCALDLQSFAFRYPVDKSGNRNLKEVSLLNVRQFGEVMNRISSFLESVSCGISAYLDHVPEA
jgi:hypothetical protein